MTVKFSKVKNAKKYEIRYAVNKKFTKAETKSTKKLTCTLKNLKKGKTYYVQARAYKKGAKKPYGAWSDTVKKKL